jgi:lipoprotein-releasing system ATP-binding protein
MSLQAKNIFKSFDYPEKVTVLSNISLNVNPGESLAIYGRSGSGKTTLLHILGTLEKPDSGEIFIGEKLVLPENISFLRRKYLGFIFQFYNLLEDLTVLENVLMPDKIAREPWNPQKGLHLLEQVGLSHRAHFPAKVLSGGEKQRASIARSLCNDPKVILADEPSGNLDAANRDAVGSLLLSLVREHNKSLILVTHDEKLASLCDRQFELVSEKK